jgi:hypothetical protein
MNPDETSASQWWAQEDFWRATTPFMFSPAAFEAGARTADQLVQLAQSRSLPYHLAVP